jgi:hypothetical protein
LKLQRRDALWAIKPLRGEPLALWAAAADREARAAPFMSGFAPHFGHSDRHRVCLKAVAVTLAA